jgi:hypothetical protein
MAKSSSTPAPVHTYVPPIPPGIRPVTDSTGPAWPKGATHPGRPGIDYAEVPHLVRGRIV